MKLQCYGKAGIFIFGVIFFLTTNIFASSEIINDEFSLGLLDNRIWQGVLVDMIYQEKGILFGNKGQLLTRISLPPQIIIKGRAEVGCIPGDQFSIYLRTDGSFRNGIVVEFKVGGDWPENAFVGKNIHLYEIGGHRVEADCPIQAYTTYDFKIVDDSTNVILYFNNLNTPLLTLATTKRSGYKLGFLKNGSTTPDTELFSLIVTTDTDSQLINNQSETTNFTVHSENFSQPILSSNNYVNLTVGKGEIISIDHIGVVLRTDDGNYPRIKWEQLGKDDLSILLATPKVFAALTTFGSTKTVFNPAANYNSSTFEQQLRMIWFRGNSLVGRIQARLMIFELFKKYQESRANFINDVVQGDEYFAASKGLTVSASQAYHNWAEASEYESAKDWVDNHPGDLSRYSEQAVSTVNKDWQNPNVQNRTKAGNEWAATTTTMQQLSDSGKKYWSMAQAPGSDMFLYIGELNSFGFALNTKIPLLAIPAINVPEEISAELNSK